MPLHYTEYIDQNLKEIKDAQLLAEQQEALEGDEFDSNIDYNAQMRRKFKNTQAAKRRLMKAMGMDLPVLVHDYETDDYYDAFAMPDNAFFIAPEYGDGWDDMLTAADIKKRRESGLISMSRQYNSLATLAHELGHAKHFSESPKDFEYKEAPMDTYDKLATPAQVLGLLGVLGGGAAIAAGGANDNSTVMGVGGALIGAGLIAELAGVIGQARRAKRNEKFQTERTQAKEIKASQYAMEAIRKIIKNKAKQDIVRNDLAIALSTYGIKDPLKHLA
jgi:hypothetical protein